jgi:hypothetical protein
VNGGAEGNRTPDLDIANVALSQLSYGPTGPGLGKADNVGARASVSSLRGTAFTALRGTPNAARFRRDTDVNQR